MVCEPVEDVCLLLSLLFKPYEIFVRDLVDDYDIDLLLSLFLGHKDIVPYPVHFQAKGLVVPIGRL